MMFFYRISLVEIGVEPNVLIYGASKTVLLFNFISCKNKKYKGIE